MKKGNSEMTEEQKAKRRAWKKAWRARNPEKVKAYCKKYYEKNKEKILEYRRRYSKAHREELNERMREYQQRPERKAWRKAYFSRPDVKMKRTAYNRGFNNGYRRAMEEIQKLIPQISNYEKLLGVKRENSQIESVRA